MAHLRKCKPHAISRPFSPPWEEPGEVCVLAQRRLLPTQEPVVRWACGDGVQATLSVQVKMLCVTRLARESSRAVHIHAGRAGRARASSGPFGPLQAAGCGRPSHVALYSQP